MDNFIKPGLAENLDAVGRYTRFVPYSVSLYYPQLRTVIMKQKKISHIVMMGDSLSDRGTADNAEILGCIPMRWFAGLVGTSPKGRFTNGYVWADVISSFLLMIL